MHMLRHKVPECYESSRIHWELLGHHFDLYSVVQKNSSMFEFAAFLLPTNLGQPMHSPSALTEHVALNLAWFFLLYTVLSQSWQWNTTLSDGQIHYKNYNQIPQQNFPSGHVVKTNSHTKVGWTYHFDFMFYSPYMPNSGSLCHPHGLEEAPVAHRHDTGQLWQIQKIPSRGRSPTCPWSSHQVSAWSVQPSLESISNKTLEFSPLPKPQSLGLEKWP